MSLGGTGSRDWRVQRFTAIFLAVYVIFLVCFLFSHRPLIYEEWIDLFSRPWMQIGTLLAFISVALHAWIGLWTVLTDYVKCTVLRYTLQSVIWLALFSYLVWGIMIFWG